ncbi:aminodeoxychorismate synthase component I [Sphingomonas hylomeconis]|uniref:Probable branched-chain-amino-acid aminotransferase n=1 Tax=Sphingomonas hylomeconis TaxID=1395958 RepID=A0ABV7SPQ6_9SPHN|nr:aminodeoxychorismate synthase component I [Sphingomonas hylomeconis]
MLALDLPFVLLDDARAGGAGARLYRDPRRIITASRTDEVGAALAAMRDVAGASLAGFLAYEAGAGLEPAVGGAAPGGPLLWFGVFDGYETVADVGDLLPDPAGAWIGAPVPLVSRAAYDAQLAAVLDLIAAGDLYQANLTYRATCAIAGNPLALYAQLRQRAKAGYGAVVWTGQEALLSLSPELFFGLEQGELTCRPMKGTARRGATPAEDQALAMALASDTKQRAENLMIVDLMRNDLSRIAAPGSVAVPSLFEIEAYPTVHQMVSTVTATLAPGKDAIDVLAALFPCGSITGAPKIRAMQALGAIERTPRGAYTGSIGRIDGDGPAGRSALFNVAIRTLTIRNGDAHATFGAGGGIVADSRAAEEWDETLAKGAFLTAGQTGFDLIETMAFDPEIGVLQLERHLARLKASAELFGFAFDRHAVRNELQAATFRLRAGRRLRLLLARSGVVAIEVAPLPPAITAPLEVAIVPLPVASDDFRLRHKTSDRAFYDTARRAAGRDEVVFVDAEGFLTEGSYTNIFVPRDGVLLTPPLSRGLLPGVLRAELLATGAAIEADLVPGDLSNGFLLGNALRGTFPAIVAVANGSPPRL